MASSTTALDFRHAVDMAPLPDDPDSYQAFCRSCDWRSLAGENYRLYWVQALRHRTDHEHSRADFHRSRVELEHELLAAIRTELDIGDLTGHLAAHLECVRALLAVGHR